MKKITHVLFDMDGLLLNTEDIYTEATNQILSRFGKTFTWELKAKMMGRKAYDAAQLFVQEMDIPMTAEEYMKERNDLHVQLFPKARPLPGILTFVQHLHQNKIPMAVATSSYKDNFEIKAKHNQDLFQYFDCIVCGNDPEIQQGKPHPDIFQIAAKRLGHDLVDPSTVLVFEDSPSGVLAGLNANMSVVWIPDPNLDLDQELKDKVDLLVFSMEDFDPTLFGLPGLRQ